MSNTLYYGDNLQVMREHLPDAAVDLVYLDPPFNSRASYNILFREKSGEDSPAQIRAFNDTWHWTLEAERTFEQEIMLTPATPTAVKNMLAAFQQFLGRNDMMAYLVMMTPRLVELRRILKPTGSLYLHCDPTAEPYLRLLLDSVFGKERFLQEIIWKRTSNHNNVRRNYGATADTILFYTKSDDYTFNTQYLPYSEEQAARDYRHIDADGRRYSSSNLRAPSPRPNLTYEYKGYQPHRNGWAVSRERMEQLDAEGRLLFPQNENGRIRLKLYLDEMPGEPRDNVWTDIPPIGSRAKERLGYPTQKPQALLERIITTSSNPGDVVLDPFCGCGTAVAAAENLGRQWLGIDITHLAVALMKSRLKASFDLDPVAHYAVLGEPRDVGSARALWEQDPYQFQYWAVSLLEAQPQGEQRRGADRGIDGIIYFIDGPRRTPQRMVVQVKGGRVSPAQIRDLAGVVEREREKAAMGLFITLEEPTREMLTEAAAGGFYHSDLWQRDFPKLQIRTIGALLAGNNFDLPPRQPAYQPAERARPPAGEQGAMRELAGPYQARTVA